MSTSNENNDGNSNNIDREQNEDLWIFGYGSLIWKVNFEFEEAVPCYITGYKRVFWQGSTDHRGVPGAPGRVVTLIHSDGPEFDPDDEDVAKHNNKIVVHGVCFRIAKEKINDVLTALDIREQGGYDREFVTTHLHKVPTTTTLSSSSNPQNVIAEVPFFLQKNHLNSDSHVEEGSVLSAKSLCYIANERNAEYLGPGNSMMEMAVQIFSSQGPSGPNAEYLIKLCDGLRALHAPDDHCFELERLVLEIARQQNHDKSVEME